MSRSLRLPPLGDIDVPIVLILPEVCLPIIDISIIRVVSRHLNSTRTSTTSMTAQCLSVPLCVVINVTMGDTFAGYAGGRGCGTRHPCGFRTGIYTGCGGSHPSGFRTGSGTSRGRGGRTRLTSQWSVDRGIRT